MLKCSIEWSYECTNWFIDKYLFTTILIPHLKVRCAVCCLVIISFRISILKRIFIDKIQTQSKRTFYRLFLDTVSLGYLSIQQVLNSYYQVKNKTSLWTIT